MPPQIPPPPHASDASQYVQRIERIRSLAQQKQKGSSRWASRNKGQRKNRDEEAAAAEVRAPRPRSREAVRQSHPVFKIDDSLLRAGGVCLLACGLLMLGVGACLELAPGSLPSIVAVLTYKTLMGLG